MALFLQFRRGFPATQGVLCHTRTLSVSSTPAVAGLVVPSNTFPTSAATHKFLFSSSTNFFRHASLSPSCCPLRSIMVSPVQSHGVSGRNLRAIMSSAASSSYSTSTAASTTASLAVTEKAPEVFKALKAGETALSERLPAHLRHPLRFSTAESFTDKIYRWLDVGGTLTMWNSRKEWILDLQPSARVAAHMTTEFERKQDFFVAINAQILTLIALYVTYRAVNHSNAKAPCPSPEGFPGVDNRKKDFTTMGRLWFIEPKERCKECRWLDAECKKVCFARLKAEGYKLYVNHGDPLSIPRDKLEPPHFH